MVWSDMRQLVRGKRRLPKKSCRRAQPIETDPTPRSPDLGPFVYVTAPHRHDSIHCIGILHLLAGHSDIGSTALPTPTMPALARRRIVGTSLKMYFDLPTTQSYVSSLLPLASLATSANIDLFVIPDFVSLLPTASAIESTPILLGAQDCFSKTSGAYTGEVSPVTLRQAGVKLVEVGHAERRRLFHETDTDVAAKAAAVVAQGMTPLVCIGEVSRPGGVASAAVGAAVDECAVQIRAVLKAVPDGAELLFAYEPVWAIGAAEPASSDHVVAVTREIRRLTDGREGLVRILYGGSAGPGTFQAMKDGVDGLFLGRFAHDVGNLQKVIHEMST